MAKIQNAAPPWMSPRARYITLGTAARPMTRTPSNAVGIDVTAGRVDRDFGRGFYTTTLEKQARPWAWLRFYDPKCNPSC